MNSKIETLSVLDHDGCQYVTFAELENHIQRNLYNLVRNCEDATGQRLSYNDESIYVESLVPVLKWYLSEYPEDADVASAMLKGLTKKKNKRAYSTTHRIEIAYATRYRCGMCYKMLPPTFEIDHVIELRHGGEDVFSNCVALCPNCHATKTRANTLKKDAAFQKHFGRRVKEIEAQIFDNLKYNNTSKYFQ